MDWDDGDARHQDRLEDRDYRRIELITGRRRRRNWTAEEKALVVSESARPGASISEVARRWGVNRGLLSVWRRQIGVARMSPGRKASAGLQFVPIAIADEDGSEGRERDATACALASTPPDFADAGRMEVEIGGNRMVVTGRMDPVLAAAMVAALRGVR